MIIVAVRSLTDEHDIEIHELLISPPHALYISHATNPVTVRLLYLLILSYDTSLPRLYGICNRTLCDLFFDNSASSDSSVFCKDNTLKSSPKGEGFPQSDTITVAVHRQTLACKASVSYRPYLSLFFNSSSNCFNRSFNSNICFCKSTLSDFGFLDGASGGGILLNCF